MEMAVGEVGRVEVWWCEEGILEGERGRASVVKEEEEARGWDCSKDFTRSMTEGRRARGSTVAAGLVKVVLVVVVEGRSRGAAAVATAAGSTTGACC